MPTSTEGAYTQQRLSSSTDAPAGGTRLVAAMEAVDKVTHTFVDDFGRAVALGAPLLLPPSPLRRSRRRQCAPRLAGSATARWQLWKQLARRWRRRVRGSAPARCS